MNNEWKNLYTTESSNGTGIQILVRGYSSKVMQKVHVGKFIDEISIALDVAETLTDPTTEGKKDKLREDFRKCFPESIFMEEIPNEYWGSKDPYSITSPWYMVTTSIGHFKIGWRKRVINIDWSKTLCSKEGKDIFPEEHKENYPTVGDKYIHAYGYEKATEYIKKIIEAK